MTRTLISDAARLDFLADLAEAKGRPELAADIRRAVAKLRGALAGPGTPPSPSASATPATAPRR
jgi:hypothetical protein